MTQKDIGRKGGRLHVLFSICDHFEPFWNRADHKHCHRRTDTWVENIQSIASRHRDCLGNPPRYAFFYPIEEYNRRPYGKDWPGCVTADWVKSRSTYIMITIPLKALNKPCSSYKKMLADEHGLLSISRFSREIMYGFIHGNWALDNSRPDGRWCGVNNEISVLIETGCYADFTMPSAPSDTQTRTVNSIYYAIDDPEKPKSHDNGKIRRCRTSRRKGTALHPGSVGARFQVKKVWNFAAHRERRALRGHFGRR